MDAKTIVRLTIRLVLLMLMTLSYGMLSAQEHYNLIKADQHFVVKGTSTLDDWHKDIRDGIGERTVT
jgi:hypothetical protein